MCKPAQLPDRCGIGSWRENQIVKLKRGSAPSTGLGADNRMYYEPSAQRQIRFYWTRLEEFLLFGSHCFQSRLNGRRGSCLRIVVNAIFSIVETGT